MKLTEYPGVVGKLEAVDCGNRFFDFRWLEKHQSVFDRKIKEGEA